MSAIFYVLRKSLKNTLLELLHHPAKLILYLFVIFIVLASGISNMVSANGDGTLLDIRMLEGIYLGALLLVLIPALLMGLRSGTTFFTMSDVSLLFSAPISSKKILSYGLLKQAGTTLLLTFLLLSYGGMAIRMFGLPIWQGILLLVGFALTIPLTQMTTMTVYSYVNGNERRIKMVKTILYLLIVLLAAVVGWHIYRNGVSQDSLFAAVSSPWLEFFPVAGWMKGLLFAVFTGNVPRILLFAGLLAVGIVVCLVLFLRSDADYYEDVLQNTESTYAMRQAVKEGRVAAGAVNTRTPKVKDTGLKGGWGASAFFYKQVRELRRRSPLLFVNSSTVILLAAVLFMGFVLRNTDDLSPNLILMIMLCMGVYVLFFLNAAGEWGREIMKPYLYMVPASPLKKLIWASLTSIIKPAVDGVVIFVVGGILVKASPLTVAVSVLMFFSFGCLFTSSNILSQRLLGQMANKGLIIVLYILIVLLLTLPGIAAGLVLYFGFHTPGAVMGIPVAVWNIGLSFGIYAICQNTLHNMETH